MNRFVTASLAIAGALILPCWSGHAHGQSGYPGKPIRLVVPFPPGASVDVMARIFGEKLREGLGQPVVVDNRAGAGGAIGAELVAKLPPDGYTLMFTSVSYTTNAAVQPRLPFDPINDIAGVAMIGRAPMLLVVHSRSAGENREGTHRSRQRAPGTTQLRIERFRHAASSADGTADA